MKTTTTQAVALLSSVLPDGVTIYTETREKGIRFTAQGECLKDVQAARLAMLDVIRANGLKGTVLNMPRRNRNDTRKQFIWAIGQYENRGYKADLVGEIFRCGFELTNVVEG